MSSFRGRDLRNCEVKRTIYYLQGGSFKKGSTILYVMVIYGVVNYTLVMIRVYNMSQGR